MVWAWVGGILVLLLAAAAVVGWLVLQLWRQARVLGAEVGRLAEQVETAVAHLDADQGHTA